MSTTDTIVKTRTRIEIKEPPKYRVIYMNDEVTTVEFVIESMVTVFSITHLDAEDLAFKVHQEGSAVVAVLPYEMAEQKGSEVTLLARQNGFPLVVKMEIDE